MKTLLKTAAITALITGFANIAQAGSPTAFADEDYLAMVEPAKIVTPHNGSAELRQAAFIETEKLNAKSIDLFLKISLGSSANRVRRNQIVNQSLWRAWYICYKFSTLLNAFCN